MTADHPPSAPGMPPPGSPARRRLAILLLVGLALRAGAWWLTLESAPVLDEADYYGRAARTARGEDVGRESARAPASIWTYAAALRILGERPEAARAVNVLLGALLPLLVYGLGRRAADERAGWIAGLATAAYPDLVLFGAGLWSEPLYLVLSTGAVLLLLDREHPPRPARVAAAGALLGAAALTREVGAILAAACGLWLVARSGPRSPRGWAGAALLGLACAAVLAPWSLRQSREHGHFVLVTGTSWLNLYLGNVPMELQRAERGPDRPALALNYLGYRKLGDDPDEREAAARRIVRERIADRMPWWPLEKIAEMVPRIVTPNSLPTARLLARPGGGGWEARHAYVTPLDGTAAEALRDGIAYANVAAWGLLLVAGTAGLCLGRGHPAFGLCAFFVAAHLLPPVLTFGQARFRLPIVPWLAVGAGYVLVHGGHLWRTAGPRRRAAAVATTIAVAGASASFWWTVATPQWG